MANPLNWFYDKFSKDPSKMLIVTGLVGWALSSLAQIYSIVSNDKIPTKEKHFLIRQEFYDAVVNMTSFLVLTQSSKMLVNKLFKSGKWSVKSVREFLQKNPSSQIGKYETDLAELFKSNKEFPLEAFEKSTSLATTVATVGASIVSSNLITPVLRNVIASRKTYVEKDNACDIQDKNIQNPTFKAHPYYCYKNSFGMKI